MYRAASRFIQRCRDGLTPAYVFTGRQKRKTVTVKPQTHPKATTPNGLPRPSTPTAPRPVAPRPSGTPARPPDTRRDLERPAPFPVVIRFRSARGHQRTRTLRVTTLERVAALLGTPEPLPLRETQAYLAQLFAANAAVTFLDEGQLVALLACVPRGQRRDLLVVPRQATGLGLSST